jgi:hypothetical protein
VGASGVTMGAEDPDEAGPWLYGGARGDAVDPTPPCEGWPTRGYRPGPPPPAAEAPGGAP